MKHKLQVGRTSLQLLPVPIYTHLYHTQGCTRLVILWNDWMSKLKFDPQKSGINQDSFFLSTDFSFKKVLLPFAFAKVHFRFLYTTRAMFPKHDLFSGTQGHLLKT